MNQAKKQKILNELKAKKKRTRGEMVHHLGKMIKNFDESLQDKDVREYISTTTGIKIRKIGCFIF